jgi:hypothetical protein
MFYPYTTLLPDTRIARLQPLARGTSAYANFVITVIPSTFNLF